MIGGQAVFPAHAGMNRPRIAPLPWQFGVPRSRGDEPLLMLAQAQEKLCFPLTRG